MSWLFIGLRIVVVVFFIFVVIMTIRDGRKR